MVNFKIGDEVEFKDDCILYDYSYYSEIKNFIIKDILYSKYLYGGTIENPILIVNLDGFSVMANHIKLKENK